VHSEMFPLLDREHPNTVELFQIWLNLPAENKLVEPHFAMLWDRDVPRHTVVDDEGRVAEVTVIAGELAGLIPPPPPPHSWASRPDSDVAIWHVRLDPGATFELPPAASADTVRVLYVFEGGPLRIATHHLDRDTGVVLRSDVPVRLASDAGAECLVLGGRPIGEPVAQRGPFVMNTEEEIRQAMTDYRRTEFGGWPWPVDDPVHGRDQDRFARHADGRVDDV